MRGWFESAVAGHRRDRERAFIASLPRDQPLLLVAPNRTAGMAPLRAHTRATGSLFGWETTSLFGLAQRFAQSALVRADLTVAPPLARVALCARVVAEASEHRALGRFSQVAHKPGFPSALAHTLDELSLEGIAADRLEALDADLAGLMRMHDAAMADLQLAQPAQVYRLATERLRARPDPRPVLAIDPNVRHRHEGAFLAAVLEARPQALCTVPSGDRRTIQWLQGTGLPRLDDDGASAGLFDSTLQRLQRHLFDEEAPRGADDDAVTVLSAPGEARECVELARRLLWAAEDGVPFERMAIVCRRADHYQAHLATALARAGIPARFTAHGRRPDPAGRALLALLACRAEDYSAARFAEYLSLSVVPKGHPTGQPRKPHAEREDPGPNGPEQKHPEPAAPYVAPAHERAAVEDDAEDLDEAPDRLSETDTSAAVVDGGLRRPSRWQRLLVEAAVIGGRARWERRLAGLGQALELQAQALIREGASEQRIAAERADLNALTRFALPVLEQLSALPERAPWGAWFAALSDLARATIGQPSRVLSVLSELAPMEMLGPVELPEVQWVLSAPLSEIPAGDTTPTDEGAVFVGSAEDARGLDFDLVCVPGLAEKLFPEKVREDPLLLDDARRALDPLLETNRDRAAQERLALRLAVGAANRRLLLSYPRIDLDRVRPRVPSFYGLEILRASEGRLPSYDELMTRAEEAAAMRIGWPAPEQSLDAIDAAEHDLSVLQPPLSRQPGQSTGAARYLLAANEHLARALRFRARRWELRKFTPADGLVDPGPETLRVLAQHATHLRAYSATALQSYARCPYRFLLHAIIGLRAAEPAQAIEHLDPGQRGALFHDAQFMTLCALRDRGLLPLPDTDDAVREAESTLNDALDTVARDYRERLCPAIDRVFDDGVEELRADLRSWLRRGVVGSAWTPSHFELAFGLGVREASDPDSRQDALTLSVGLRLRGSIDLVERAGDRLRATDHKTGVAAAPTDLRIGGGEVLQPALYALALEALFPGAEVDSGRLYFCTAKGEFQERAVPLDEATKEAVARLVTAVDTAITTGFLPAAPADGACEHCDYQVVCGPYEEQRCRRKRKTRLSDLHALRNEP
ncbi:MAG: PD-(D/E)XK nuclease family protein [Myxococcales bacterium]|nr:PD-(D/E)XK nuclease family protein [Myxococcales bacterium]